MPLISVKPSFVKRLVDVERRLLNIERHRRDLRIDMHDLADADLASVRDGQVPSYNVARGMWEPVDMTELPEPPEPPPDPATSVVVETSFGLAPAVGTRIGFFALEDHTHGTPLAPPTGHSGDPDDPHPDYLKVPEHDTTSRHPVEVLPVGNAPGTVAAGADPRFPTQPQRDAMPASATAANPFLVAAHREEEEPAFAHAWALPRVERGAPGGVASLNNNTLVPVDQLGVGAAPDRFLRGDHTWQVVSTGGGSPTGPAGGVLAGEYPNPTHSPTAIRRRAPNSVGDEWETPVTSGYPAGGRISLRGARMVHGSVESPAVVFRDEVKGFDIMAIKAGSAFASFGDPQGKHASIGATGFTADEVLQLNFFHAGGSVSRIFAFEDAAERELFFDTGNGSGHLPGQMRLKSTPSGGLLDITARSIGFNRSIPLIHAMAGADPFTQQLRIQAGTAVVAIDSNSIGFVGSSHGWSGWTTTFAVLVTNSMGDFPHSDSALGANVAVVYNGSVGLPNPVTGFQFKVSNPDGSAFGARSAFRVDWVAFGV